MNELLKDLSAPAVSGFGPRGSGGRDGLHRELLARARRVTRPDFGCRGARTCCGGGAAATRQVQQLRCGQGCCQGCRQRQSAHELSSCTQPADPRHYQLTFVPLVDDAWSNAAPLAASLVSVDCATSLLLWWCNLLQGDTIACEQFRAGGVGEGVQAVGLGPMARHMECAARSSFGRRPGCVGLVLRSAYKLRCEADIVRQPANGQAPCAEAFR